MSGQDLSLCAWLERCSWLAGFVVVSCSEQTTSFAQSAFPVYHNLCNRSSLSMSNGICGANIWVVVFQTQQSCPGRWIGASGLSRSVPAAAVTCPTRQSRVRRLALNKVRRVQWVVQCRVPQLDTKSRLVSGGASSKCFTILLSVYLVGFYGGGCAFSPVDTQACWRLF